MTTLNWPGFGLASISPTLDQPSQSNSSAWTGTRTVITTPWHGKWSFKVTLATRQGDAAFQAARAFFTSLKGQIGTFHLPAVEAPQNGNTGVTLASNAAQGATSLALTGVTTALGAGNMVTIAGQLLSLTTVGSLSGSAQTVNFMPALRAAASSGASVETAKPYALVYLSDSSFTWDIGSWRRYGMSFSAAEAVGETDGADPALDIWTGGTGGTGGGGSVFSFPTLTSFISRTLLAAVVSPTDKQLAYLTEAGREGDFVFSTANLSTSVTADPQQGIYVAPAADTTGASGAWVRKFSGGHNVKWFGAKCDTSKLGVGGTDDTAAVQAAIDFVFALGGGTVVVPGHTKCASTLAFNSKYNIRFVGNIGQGAGYNAPPPAQIIYTGTGSRFIDARSSLGLAFVNLGIRYTSASFTGDLIDFAHDGAGGDAAYGLIERCLVGGISVYSARSLISLDKAILCSVVDNHLQWGGIGILGRALNSGYSNAHYIGRNTFDNLSVSGIMSAVEGWTVISNWFEGTDGGTGGMPRAYYDTTNGSGEPTANLSWINNWHGDATNVHNAWFDNNTAPIEGLTIDGGLFSTLSNAIPCIKLGTVIGGNITGVTANLIDFSSNANTASLTVKNNYLQVELANLPTGPNNEFGPNSLSTGFGQTRRWYSDIQVWQMGGLAGEAGTNGAGYFNWLAPAATDLNFALTGRASQRNSVVYRTYGVGEIYYAGINTSGNYEITVVGVGAALTIDKTTRAAAFAGSVGVGGGTALTKIVAYSPSITPASVAAATVAEQTFTVTGLTTADKVIVNPPAIANATGIAGARVSAADTLAIRFVNPTAGALTPTSGTYTVMAMRS